jgi:hypothetical protein
MCRRVQLVYAEVSRSVRSSLADLYQVDGLLYCSVRSVAVGDSLLAYGWVIIGLIVILLRRWLNLGRPLMCFAKGQPLPLASLEVGGWRLYAGGVVTVRFRSLFSL